MTKREGIGIETKKGEKSSKKLVSVMITAMIVIFGAAIVVITGVVAGVSESFAGWMEIAYILFGVSILVFVIMLTYILHTVLVRMRVKKEDRIKEILKEAKRIEDKIKEEGLSLSLAIIAMLFTMYARI